VPPEIKDLRALSDEEIEAELARRRVAAGPPPSQKSPRKKKSREGPKYLDADQLVSLFGAIRSMPGVDDSRRARDLAIFELGFGRGLRACEVGKLRLDSVINDRGSWRLRVSRAKGSRGGEYLLSDRESKALRGWLRVRGKDPGPLFPSRVRRPISTAALDDLIKAYGGAAELPRELCHFHVLRHSCAMRLVNELDTPIEEVQDHLGHASIKNTQIYFQLSNARRRRKDERLRSKW
jgi:integrase